MDFKLTEEHIMIRDAARDFAKTELLPGVIERDEKQEFPKELVKKMGDLGFLGMMASPEYGGGGMDTISYILVMEELSKIDASASVMVSVNNSLVCWGLDTYGSEEQKKKYLSKLTTGEKLGAFCLSEPEAGSDATSQRTTAIDKGDHYVLNGTKNWITNGSSADYYLVIAQTDREKKHKGINAFMTFQLPKAIIALKPGAGRLIRDEMDKGVLMICDQRIVSKPYGKRFWRSLPDFKRTREQDDVIEFLKHL